MISVLDIETTFTEDGDNTPYNLRNKLVSVGVNDEYYFLITMISLVTFALAMIPYNQF